MTYLIPHPAFKAITFTEETEQSGGILQISVSNLTKKVKDMACEIHIIEGKHLEMIP